MHSYQHNIKTFNSATRHLTRVERSLYRDLIELYYDMEQPIQSVDFSRLCRQVLAHADEEKSALQYVLSEFFVLTGDVYTHNYCDEIIEKYKANVSAKAKAGAASAESKKNNAKQRINERAGKIKQEESITLTEFNTCSTVVTNQKQETNNHKPLTINQEPNKKHTASSDARAKSAVQPFGVLDSVWKDFIAIRKAKRAPLTDTALQGIEQEALKAGMTLNDALSLCCMRGWQGFKAEWAANGTTGNKQADIEARNAEVARKYIEMQREIEMNRGEQ